MRRQKKKENQKSECTLYIYLIPDGIDSVYSLDVSGANKWRCRQDKLMAGEIEWESKEGIVSNSRRVFPML